MNALQQTCSFIDAKLKEKENIIIVIEGEILSGKTYLSHDLESIYQDIRVIHMDDFYLSKDQRGDTKEYGFNIDKKQFMDSIVNFLDKDIEFEKWSCKTNNYSIEVLNKKRITVIEGNYSLLKEFGDYYDYLIYLNIDSSLQLRRLEKRNPSNKDMFLSLWIPLARTYLEKEEVKKKADLVLN